jgi:hypothetical protein
MTGPRERLRIKSCVAQGYGSTLSLMQDAWLEHLRATPEFERTLSILRDREHAAYRAFANAGGERIFGSGRDYFPTPVSLSHSLI